MFEGLYTALVTPFRGDSIDYDALEKIIEHQIKGGVDGVVPAGTTGESPTLSFDEHKELIRQTVKMVNGRVKVVAGTGANSTREAICLSKSAEDAGANGILSVNPYYNKPTQEGLILHFEAIANSISIPVILYNIPGRTAVNFMPESVASLLERVDNITAIKEATGDLAQMMRVHELCGDRLTLLSGDDNLLLPLLSIGGKGIISVLSNLFPADLKAVIDNFNNNDIIKSREAFYKILPLCRAMFLETNPIPIKSAMAMAGYCSSDMRLPMVPLGPANKEVLAEALKKYGADFI